MGGVIDITSPPVPSVDMLLTAYNGAILGPIAKVLGWVMNGIYALMSMIGIETVSYTHLSPCGTACLRNLVSLDTVYTSGVCEEHHVVMGCRQDVYKRQKLICSVF